jgi:DNA-binding transcriptional MerR regulator
MAGHLRLFDSDTDTVYNQAMTDRSAFTIEELAERVGAPVRTVRFYIAEGLVPRPDGRGKAVWYGEEHLLRLRLARLLAERRMPLAEIRARLAGLSLEEVRALLAEEERRAGQVAEAAKESSPKAYVSALLERARADRRSVGDRPAAAPAPPFTLAEVEVPGYSRSRRPPLDPSDTWQRIELAPGVELHVRADAEVRHGPLVERVLRSAGRLRRSWSGPLFGGPRPGGAMDESE